MVSLSDDKTMRNETNRTRTIFIILVYSLYKREGGGGNCNFHLGTCVLIFRIYTFFFNFLDFTQPMLANSKTV